MNLRALQRRHIFLVIVGCALLLPVIAVLVLQVFNLNRDARAEIQREAVRSAEAMSQRSDVRASANLAALQVLAANISPEDIARSLDIANTAVQLNAAWKSVVLYDRVEERIIFDAAKDGRKDVVFKVPSDMPAAGMTEGVQRDGLHCPCVRLHAPLLYSPRYVLTVFVDPIIFQQVLLAEIPDGSVGAIVDRQGDFLARSVDYEARVGTPATSYVRDAVKAGGEGIYRGETYEGLKNYTAYKTSEITGWSAHVAINHALIDTPSNMAMIMLLLGAIACLAIAAIMIGYGYTDLTNRRLEERRIIEMQKAEAVGVFTSTLIHDFRNLLAVMHASVNLIMRQTEEDQTRETAKAARDVLERSEKVIIQFLNFARRDEPDNTRVNLKTMLTDMMDLFKKSVGGKVEIVLEMPDNVIFWANRQQFELAFVNLLTNARDAMNGSGRISIRAELVDEMCEIRITDTGPGIPLLKRDRIFDAYFTTKPAGKGTGLGLAQVSAAVRQAGGAIEISDAAEGGAEFIIRIPLAAAVSDNITALPGAEIS